MAVLNPPQNLPNLAFAVSRYLSRHPRHKAEWPTIVDVLAPAGAVDLRSPEERDRGIAPADATHRKSISGASALAITIRQCRDLGLFSISGEEVTLEAPTEPADRSSELAEFTQIVRQLVLGPAANPQGRWESDHGARDLTRALGWYLLLDPLTTPGRYEYPDRSPGIDALRSKHFGDARVLTNDTRWGSFTRWSVFLGFAARDRASGGILPDPTVAIAASLGALGPVDAMPIRQFIGRLAEVLPVLDGGIYQRWVVEHLDEAVRFELAPHDNEVTASVSHALRVLHSAGRVHLDAMADVADRMYLKGQPELLAPCSNVTVVEEPDG